MTTAAIRLAAATAALLMTFATVLLAASYAVPEARAAVLASAPR